MSDAPAAAPVPRLVETSECRISYREVGSGPPLLCLHGGGPGATGWGNFGVNSQDFADRYRVIVPDLPCFGASRITVDNGEPWERVCARALAELLAQLDASGASVIGNSAGGGVAVRMAIEHPGSLDRLVLMAPWLTGFRIPLFTPGEVEGTPLLEGYFPNPSREKMRRLILTFVQDPTSFDLETLIEARYLASTEPGIEEGLARAYADIPYPAGEPSVLDQVRAIDLPTLILWGKDDRFCSLDDALLWLACLADSRLIVLSRCGHWVQAEKRADFRAFVGSFLDESLGATA